MMTALAGGLMLRGPQVCYAPEGEGDTLVADPPADAPAETEATPAGGDTLVGDAGGDTVAAGGPDTLAGGDPPDLLGGDTKAGSDTVASGDTLAGSDTASGTQAGGDAINLVGAPEGDYVLALPEDAKGMVLDAGALAIAAPVLKELNISQEGAQALMGKLYVPLVGHVVEQANAAAIQTQKDTVAKWATEAPTDPRWGGKDNYDQAVVHAKSAYNQFVPEDAKLLFEASGLGNRPEIIAMMAGIGKAMGEGTFHRSDTEVPGAKSLGDTLYPGFNKGQAQE